jgi:SNF family Na+-dependent transporter
MPLLLVFGAILAIRGLFLTTADPGVIQSPLEGLNFVWQPQLSGIFNPSTWLAAAGQIFFTLSLGVGSVHCFAAYVREKDDIALNAVSAGWINEFAEVILGGTILIPIATAYLGLNAVQSATAGGSGFGLGFLTLPSLFNNWGWFTPFAGAMWFGLLFFAGITSSLALAQPIMAFLEDEYRFKRNPSAISVGILILVIGFFCIWLYPGGALDEFDYWAGTFGLVLFALLEIFAFISIFGIKDGWAEITRGADIKISLFFRWTIRYVTPTFITIIFITSLIKPKAAWGEAFSQLFSGAGWPLASDSVIGKILHVGEKIVWFENGQPTKVFVLDLSRMLLTVIFVLICILVHRIFKKKVGKDS